jgi:polar amino acid transport system substrate-binding protein
MNKNGIVIVGLIAIVALILGVMGLNNKSSQSSVSDKVIQNGELRIGYIVYPPLLFKDPATGQLSGVSYDLVEEAAKKLNLKTNWVEEVGWGTAMEGLKTGRYDILGTQMWPNSARAREAVFSVGPMNSMLYPYVKAGDNRFNSDLTRLNSSQYTVSAVDGEMATFIQAQDYPQAKLNSLPQTVSYAEVFLNIVNSKADITFVEPSAANDFLKTNPGTIARVGNTPVRTFGNSFAFARGQNSMVDMWNVAIGELIAEGTVQKTLEKYNVANDYSLNN